tara:strand:- start:400 stop:555 length:156 start_codon:yes stop_codon:yes gene_type:complete
MINLKAVRLWSEIALLLKSAYPFFAFIFLSLFDFFTPEKDPIFCIYFLLIQ